MFFGNFPGMSGGFPGSMSSKAAVDNTKFYETLGINKDASQADIKKAFRKLAIQHHPDKGGDPEVFKEITKAYEVLSDPEKRNLYDEHGEDGLDGSGGMDGDIFSQIFRGGMGGGRQQRQKKTADVSINIKLTLEQLYLGCTRKLSISRDEICKPCKGEGGDISKIVVCDKCKGKGVVITMSRQGPMITQSQGVCGACSGKGKSFPESAKCKTCRGAKVTKEKKIIECVVPRGAVNGQKIVFKNESDQAPGAITGDVVVYIEEEKHALFKRNGSNMLLEKTITLIESLGGTEFVVNHLDGRKLLIKTPAGVIINPGSTFAVKHEGFPKAENPAINGDLIIKFTVEFPDTLTEDIKSKLATLLPANKDKVNVNDPSFEPHYLETADPNVFEQKPEQAKEAYHEEDMEDEEGGPQGVSCAQQ